MRRCTCVSLVLVLGCGGEPAAGNEEVDVGSATTDTTDSPPSGGEASTGGSSAGEGGPGTSGSTTGSEGTEGASSSGGTSDAGETEGDESGGEEPTAIVYGSDGSGSARGVADCTVQTDDPVAALASAVPNDVVCVTGGVHGVLSVEGPLTLRAIGSTEVAGLVVSGASATVDGFTVTGIGSNDAAIYAGGTGHTIVGNRVVSPDASFGIRVPADLTIVRGNTVTGVQHWGIDTRGDGNRLERNNIFDLRRLSLGSDVDGVKFHGSDLVLRENYIHDINQYASVYDDDPPHVDCFQSHASSDIVTQRVLIERNYCVRVSRQCLIAEHPVVGNIVFRDNVCETHDNQNINVKRSLGGPVWIYNNIVAGSPDKAIYTNSASGESNDPDIYIVNNIARGNPGDGMTLLSGPSTALDNNVLLEDDSPFVFVPEFDSPQYAGYAETQAADFDADGPRAWALAAAGGQASVAVPSLPAWLAALEGDAVDIDGNPRPATGVSVLGPFEP
ncbi:MAG: right-handed parallel beta-helix repeat-containing protein [Myxococcota bacterium]